MKRRKVNLAESASLGRSRLDRNAGVVRGVKILGSNSAHGYEYSAGAMEGAVHLYEGKQVNLNHPNRKNLGASRRYEDRFGRLKNVRYVEGKGLYGDLHYNKGHRIVKQFEYDVDHEPRNLGLSHNASGSAVRRGDRVLVESIDKVRSVDLVADPATNVGLFESRGAKMGLKVRRKKSSRTKQARLHLRKFLEAVGTDEETAASAMSPKEAMGQMILAIFMDDSIDMEETKRQIMAILQMQDKEEVAGDESSEESDDAESSDMEVPEDRGETVKKSKKNAKSRKPAKKSLVESKVERQLRQYRREQALTDLCEDMGVRLTKVQRKAALSLPTKKEAKQFLESLGGDLPTVSERVRRDSKPKSRSAHSGSRRKEYKESKDWLEGIADPI